MGKKSSKPADVIGASKQEGEEARKLAREETFANRPDQYNPWGSTTWDVDYRTDPVTGEKMPYWKQTETLNPQLQKALESQFGLQAGRSGLAGSMFGNVSDQMGTPMDWAQFGDIEGMEFDPTQIRQQAEDAAYGRSTSRLDPQFAQREQDLEIKLRNQGLSPGDQAYDAAMGSLGRERTDAYDQARMGATQQGMAEAGQLWQQQYGQTELANKLREQAIQEGIGKRQFGLDEINKLLAGQGVAGSTPSSPEAISVQTG